MYMDTYQTPPKEIVLSGSIVFAIQATDVHKQRRELTTKVVDWRERVSIQLKGEGRVGTSALAMNND